MSTKWTPKKIKARIVEILKDSNELMHVTSIHFSMPSLELNILKQYLGYLSRENIILYENNNSTINGYKINQTMNWNVQISKLWRRPVHELYNTQECRTNAR